MTRVQTRKRMLAAATCYEREMSDMPHSQTPSWAERWVRFLDDGVRVPGTSIRFGADAVLGLIAPAVGDAAGALMSLGLFKLAWERKVPSVVLLRMLLNVGLDTLVGSLPFVGDVFDFVFKANRKNLRLIEQHSERGEKKPAVRDYVIMGAAGLFAVASVLVPLWLTVYVLRALFGN